MHMARPALVALLLGAIVGIASCRMYGDAGVPRPSSTWTWMCADGSLAPDAGCPDAGSHDGGSDGSGDGGHGGDPRQAR